MLAGVIPLRQRILHPRQESPAIATRKPPSQRPERKLDATARAIAAAREAAVAEKAAASQGAASDPAKPGMSRGGRNNLRPTVSGPAPSPSTKRPKQPGG